MHKVVPYSWHELASQDVMITSLPRVHMREGVKQLVLSVCQFVSQSSVNYLNLNIDGVKQFPNLTVALTL